MRGLTLTLFAGVVFLSACNDVRKPSDDNFRKTINQYLAKYGTTCTWFGRPFPIDVSMSEQKMKLDADTQMAVLEAAGLVRSSDMVVAAPSIFGPAAPRRVKRYQPTDDGSKYLQQAPGSLGHSPGFCYGDKTVDSIVKWTEPVTSGAYSQSEVSYTYKITNLAPWAKRSDVQYEFGDIRATLDGISKSTELAGLQLTNQGWEVPTQ